MTDKINNTRWCQLMRGVHALYYPNITYGRDVLVQKIISQLKDLGTCKIEDYIVLNGGYMENNIGNTNNMTIIQVGYETY